MATLKAPSISIAFNEKAETVFTRGERGVCGLVLQDTVLQGTEFTVLDSTDIPSTLSSANTALIESALIGNTTAPKKVVCYVMALDSSSAPDYDDALDWVENSTVDVVAFSKVATDSKTSDVKTGIIAMRGRHKRIMCVLPSTTADSEGIVNWDGTVYKSGTAVAKEDYCCRIAGAIAGTGLTSSITYMTLTDVDNCTRMSDDDIDTAVGAGKLIPMWDGEKVKIVNDVTSFQTTTTVKGDSFKVIKLVRDMDMIYQDIYTVVRDTYTGKFTNSYDNQCVLLTQINNYLKQCVADGIFASAVLSFDIDSKKVWVKDNIATYPTKFVDKNGDQYVYEDMTDQDFKECWSSNKLFYKGTLSMLDTMKDFTFEFNI